MVKIISSLIGIVALLSIIAGCGGRSDIERVVVVGTVKLNGAPIQDGQIRYVPMQGTLGPVSVSMIRDGSYRCDMLGGVPVGTHRVEILAWDPNVAFHGPGSPPRPQWVPEKYNRKSDLTISLDGMTKSLEKDWDL